MGMPSEPLAFALAALALTACGPAVHIDDGSADGTAEGSVSGESEDASATEAVDGTGTTEPTDGSTGEPPAAGWCLHGTPLPQLSASNELLAVYDADGDGRDEVWMAEPPADPRDPWSRILAYELEDGPVLAPILEVMRWGRVHAMVDIDADGLRDVVMAQPGDPSRWWLAGLPGASIDELAQPLHAPSTSGTWIDADGDGATDYFETITTGLVLYMGDGAGGFVQADTLDFGIELGSARVWPSGLPGRPLVGFQEQSFQPTPTTLWAVEVSPAGAIALLSSGSIGTIEVKHVGDIDGDMIPDVLGYDAVDNHGLSFAYQGAPGSYTVDTTEIPIYGMTAGSFVSDGAIDLLYWELDETEVFVRPREDGLWATVLPVTVLGSWQRSGSLHTMQADGEGSTEILHQNAAYELWTFEPCG